MVDVGMQYERTSVGKAIGQPGKGNSLLRVTNTYPYPTRTRSFEPYTYINPIALAPMDY
jgi:hypothetical protein